MRGTCGGCGAVIFADEPVTLVECATCGVTARFERQSSDFSSSSATEVDHYKVLGVESTATQDSIKSAYRRRSKETHPDAGGSSDEFSLVAIAYEVLGDPVRRAAYDGTWKHSVGAATSLSKIVPDVAGMTPRDASKMLSVMGIAVRISLVESSSRVLDGRVVGQYPYAGSTVDSGTPILVLVSTPPNSALWQTVKLFVRQASREASEGFVAGLKRSTGTEQRLALESGGITAARQTGEVLGVTVGIAAKTTVQTASCLGHGSLYVFLGLVSLICLLLSPPIGIVVASFSIFVLVRLQKGMKERASEGRWY